MTAPTDANSRMTMVALPNAESWLRLIGELQHAAQIDKDETPGTEMPGHSASWIVAQAFLKFMMEQPAFKENPKNLDPLVRLASAMIDLRRGRVSAMFKPPKRNGNPGNSSTFEAVKGTAARAMSELMLAGMTRPAAARAVAQACGTLRGHGKITAKTVAGWRDVLEAGAGPGAPEHGAALFSYRKQLPSDFGATPMERGNGLIEVLRGLGGRFG